MSTTPHDAGDDADRFAHDYAAAYSSELATIKAFIDERRSTLWRDQPTQQPALARAIGATSALHAVEALIWTLQRRGQ